MSSNELYHHGVKGMKLGVRRYQNEDGTRTSAGKKHVQTLGYDSSAYKRAKKQYSRDFDAAAKAASKTKSFAITKRGKEKKARLDADYSAKYDQMNKSRNTMNSEKKKLDSAKKSAVKEYSKKFNKASHASDIADQKWTEVKAEYKALGKTRVTRMLNAAQNKTAAAKKYNKDFNTASSMSDKADALWRESNEAYKKTGRNYIGRVLNNVKYG